MLESQKRSLSQARVTAEYFKGDSKKLNIKTNKISSYACNYCNAHGLKLDRVTIDYLKEWNQNISDIIKKQEKTKNPEDIRKYFCRSTKKSKKRKRGR